MNSSKKYSSVAVLVLALGLTGLGTSACSSSTKASCSDASAQIQKAVAANSSNAGKDPKTTVADAKTLAASITDAANKASDPKAKSALTNFATDYSAMVDGLEKVENGDSSALGDLQGQTTKLQADMKTVQDVCGK